METRQALKEKHGFRNEWYSNRHRNYGFECFMVDIDFIEHDKGIPVALIETKHANTKEVDLWHYNIKALCALADASKIPAFVVVYFEDLQSFYVTAINQFAKECPGKERIFVDEMYSEERYVKLLYFLRGKKAPQDILDKTCKITPKAGEYKVPVFNY